MAKITFKIAAKTDVGLVRTNNEDNFIAVSDLDFADSTWRSDEVCELGERGELLVVADGMGGMNAGEVASEIAISTVKELFTQNLTDEITSSDKTIVQFMNEAVIAADKRIKSEGKRNPESRGMGTTIVIAWLHKGLLYVSWCGDSRAYIFNPSMGLVRITKDHSYVQDLVDQGVVRPEEAFDFPESNVITRCLSDSSSKAQPDNLTTPYSVSVGDIVLLCTDGLCGMIRDNEIASVIAAHTGSMDNCATELIEAAKRASGADNVTVDLCQIISIDNEMPRTPTAELSDIEHLGNSNKESKKEQAVEVKQNDDKSGSFNGNKNNLSKKKEFIIKLKTVFFTLLFCALVALGYYLLKEYKTKQPKETITEKNETTESAATTDSDNENTNSVSEETNKTKQ